MKIFITGGTGFIGRTLCHALLKQGHQLTVLTRQPKPPIEEQGVSYCHYFTAREIGNFEAVINLAGEPIFAKRWTKAQKRILTDSRIQLTRQLTEAIRESKTPPNVFLSASATGIYGNLPRFAKNCEQLTPCNPHFLASLCQQWEAEALKAQSDNTRVCLLRTGMVLDKNGGALQQMLPLYRLGLGGRLGTGKQHWAWIALQDQVRAILFLLNNKNSQGAYNLVAPESISNADFNRQLAKMLKRPEFCHTPEFILKLALGERSQLLLNNQPLVPQRLISEGFTFSYPKLTEYLQENIR